MRLRGLAVAWSVIAAAHAQRTGHFDKRQQRHLHQPAIQLRVAAQKLHQCDLLLKLLSWLWVVQERGIF